MNTPSNSDVHKDDSIEAQRTPCPQCGGSLHYQPGTTLLTCPHCGHEVAIEDDAIAIVEQDFHQQLRALAGQEESQAQLVVNCESCGAQTQLGEHESAKQCAFCGSDIIATTRTRKLIKPKALLPFKILKDEARTAYRKWIKGLWFAPTALKRQALSDTGIQGVYIPYWTYDSDTRSYYRGERGTYYYVTRTRTVTDGAGRERTETYEERRTRWDSVHGRVYNHFDDLLVNASAGLPRKYVQALEPWDLEHLVSYRDDYLSGFQAQSYQCDLEEGFAYAQERMRDVIDASIRRHIGGDDQRIHDVDTRYYDVSFKHILLPVWLSAYRFKGETYRFMINARTGEVQGERPWSWLKISLFVLTVLAVIGLGVLLSKM